MVSSGMPASIQDRVPSAARNHGFVGMLIAAELLCRLWLLLRPRSQTLTPVWIYTAVTLLWTGLGLQGGGCGRARAYLRVLARAKATMPVPIRRLIAVRH